MLKKNSDELNLVLSMWFNSKWLGFINNWYPLYCHSFDIELYHHRDLQQTNHINVKLTSPSVFKVYDKVRRAAIFINGLPSTAWSYRIQKHASLCIQKEKNSTASKSHKITIWFNYRHLFCNHLENLLSQKNQKTPLSGFCHLIRHTNPQDIQNTSLQQSEI